MIFTEEQMKVYCGLIKDSVERNDYSSERLGDFVSALVKAVLDTGNFCNYTEDWKVEMFGEACLQIYDGMKGCDLSDTKRAYNYLYTTARNRIVKVITKLKNEMNGECEILDDSENTLQPFYVRNKRTMMKGLLDRKKAEIVQAASSRKQMMLHNAVGKAVNAVMDGIDSVRIIELIKMSRKVREAALC